MSRRVRILTAVCGLLLVLGSLALINLTRGENPRVSIQATAAPAALSVPDAP
jgi:hypothetical protein